MVINDSAGDRLFHLLVEWSSADDRVRPESQGTSGDSCPETCPQLIFEDGDFDTCEDDHELNTIERDIILASYGNDTRAGGRTGPPVSQDVITPITRADQKRGYPRGPPVPQGVCDKESRDRAVHEFIMAKLSKGTQVGYGGAWKRWLWFCKARKMYPYMAGETKEELQKAEDVLLEYIVHMAKTMKRTEGTVRSRLMAVRYFHVAEGCADPLKGKPRMWAA